MKKYFGIIAMAFYIVILAGCAAVKDYDWSGWWSFHKPIVETVSGWFKSDKSDVNVTVNGNEQQEDIEK